MKRFSWILMIVSMFVSSCDDFLNVTSPSTFDKDYIFESEVEVATAVNGIYLPVISLQAGSMLTRLLFNTDVEFSPVTNSSSNERAYNPSTGDIGTYNSIWNSSYDGINRANDVLLGIEQSQLFKSIDKTVPSKLMHYYAEAKVLRAVFYLDLVRNWGDVPYRREPAGDKDELFIGATDRDSILDDMITDLIEVEPYLFYAKDSDRGVEGVSREFCQGLIAKIALQRGGWSLRPDYSDPSAIGSMKRSDDWKDYYKIAEIYAGKVISEGKHDLKRSFKQVWYDECNWVVPVDDDIIFDVPTKVGGTGGLGYDWGTYVKPGTNSQGQKSSNAPQGYSSGGSKLALTYMLSFDRKDLRRDVTCEMFNYENSGLTSIVQKPAASFTVCCGKWNRLLMESPLGNTSNRGTGINWTYMRYADILLMYAEAVNENNDGPNNEAKEALKQVRRRAFEMSDWPEKVDAYVDRLSTKDEFFDAIVDERAWEFGGEKMRRYDLARWNIYGKVLYNMYFDWFTLGKVARTKQFANTSTPFEDPTYDDRFNDYPARAYYKLVDAVDPINTTIIQTVEYYKEGDISSYDQALTIYPSGDPSGYKGLDMCTRYCVQVSGTSNPREWVPANEILYSFYGYINESNASQLNPEVDPVRYILPIPPDALSSHQGTLKNYYGY